MARRFNGSSDLLSRTPSVLSSSSARTMACWFRADSLPAVTAGLVSSSHTAENLDSIDCLRLNANGSVEYFIRNDLASAAAQATSAAGLVQAGRWCHLAGVSPSISTSLCYLDGVQVASATNAGITDLTGFGRLVVGARARKDSVGNADFFAGAVAHVAVWAAALSASELAALAQGAPPTSIRPGFLVEYWPLEGLHRREEPGSVSGRALAVSGTSWAPGPIADPPRAPGLHLAALDSSNDRWPNAVPVAVAAGRPRAAGGPKKWYPGLGRDRGRRRP